LLLVAIIAGWVLALDTFAVFDIALYAIGFTPYAVLAALFFACLLQLISARSGHAQHTRHYRELAAIVLIAIVVHLLVRVPTGNLWDALLDPWLWVIAHGLAIYVVLRKTRSRQ
jgi:branched-subunit amino acid transport protein